MHNVPTTNNPKPQNPTSEYVIYYLRDISKIEVISECWIGIWHTLRSNWLLTLRRHNWCLTLGNTHWRLTNLSIWLITVTDLLHWLSWLHSLRCVELLLLRHLLGYHSFSSNIKWSFYSSTNDDWEV